jgi:hypothetical protein
MVGTWDGSVHKAVSSKWSHQRITLIQGRLGQKVARIRSVSGTQICEYTAVMTANSPSVVLRPRVTRSIPKGYCDPPPQQTMTLNGRDLRWASGDLAGTLYRARHDAVPPGLRGRWTGIAPGFTAVPTEGMRMRFDIGGGAVGTSAIRITTSIGDVTCEKEAMLISAENKIFFVPVRLLTPDGCVLGSEQQLTPKGPNLVWQDLSTDEGADLRPS